MKCNVIATAVLFVYIFVFEWVFHGVILADMYQSTAELWRSEEAMMEKLGWMIAGQALIAIFLVQIFRHLQSNTVKVGALLGALYGSAQLVMYSVAPYPLGLTLIWIVGGIVEYTLAGVLFCWMVNRKSCAAQK